MASEPTGSATDEEIARLSEAIQEQRVEIREYLARELGGDPEDYRVERYLAERALDRSGILRLFSPRSS